MALLPDDWYEKADRGLIRPPEGWTGGDFMVVGGPLDKQVGGGHYKGKGIQPIEYIQANKLTFCEGSALKYITRHREKGGREDLEKAIHYLELEIADSYGVGKK